MKQKFDTKQRDFHLRRIRTFNDPKSKQDQMKIYKMMSFLTGQQTALRCSQCQGLLTYLNWRGVQGKRYCYQGEVHL